MKLKIFFLFLMLIGSQTFAQKFGYNDTEYIMNKMPEYKKANETMNQFAEKWTKDLQAKYADVEKMKQRY